MSYSVDWTTIVTKLYETQNGTNATFQLSESAANFKRLRFFFKSNDGDYSSLDVCVQVSYDGAVQLADYIYVTRVEGWQI